MKIIHTSDWHLGMSVMSKSMLDEQEHFITQLSHIIDSEQAEAVIIAGDVFDSSVANAEAVRLYDRAMTMLCNEKKVKTFIVAGNHDGAARLSQCGEILRQSGLYVCGKLTRPCNMIECNNVCFYMIPFFNIEEVRILYPEAEIKNYGEAMNVICDEIRENTDKEKTNIIITHCFVTGGEVSESEHSAVVGTANNIPSDAFKGFDYVALGHLHRPQTISGNIVYSGTPLKYSFGESNQEKIIIVLDTETMEKKQVRITPINDMRCIEVTFDELYGNNEKSEDYLKIKVTDRYAGLEAMGIFREKYPNLLAISGKNDQGTDNEETLTVEEAGSLSPDEMLKKFYEEVYGSTVGDEQMKLFTSAVNAAEKEKME